MPGARASAWACSFCSSAPPSSAARRGWACCAGEVRALDAPGLKVPQIGWNAVAWKRESALSEGLLEPGGVLPRALVRAGRVRTASCWARPSTAREFVSAVAGDGVYGVQFHPEKSGPDGLRAACATSSRCATVILLPAVDIRDGKAVRLVQGDFAPRDRLQRRPARGREGVGRAGRARAARGRPGRRAQGRAGEPGAPARGSPRRSTSRCSTAAACATPQSVRAALAAGRRPRRDRHGRLHGLRLPRRGASARGPRASSSPSTCAAGAYRSPAGRRRRRAAPRK